ncbi:hypothetical protein RFI_14310 [Reticulomyxa filosa]|uniref:Uncharacterized protein n=1 Tax=Reticulomyxa filosa TaxID=46433 RepID=X6NAW5_RETFI|nr:hypothetical protein RFI_14310 [Reticulomyxa filosa]|eukprot:ETO22884.1 hypothetical protein RFI_14310 [Reticulomyxa filosa]
MKKGHVSNGKNLDDCSKTDEIAQKVFTEKRFQKEDSKCRLEKALSNLIEAKPAAAEKEKKESLMENIGLLKKCNKSFRFEHTNKQF